ncbi:ATPase [Thioclava sp. BHET1]|nr:ATPase [Thioclava sp. BHET1]
MALFLGMDGGGSGCRARIVDETGRVIGQAEGGPANIVSDLASAQDNLLACARKALGEAGDLKDLHAVLGLAGANVGHVAEALHAALPFRSARILSDAVIALRGALGARDGILAALGTGSVFAVQRAGEMRQIGGWGLVLGDEGSGGWIGRALLTRALHAYDGRVEMTPLLRAVLDEARGPEHLVDRMRLAPPSGFATYARRVIEAPDDGAARAVLAAADETIAEAIADLQQGAALPVCFTGGLGAVFAHRLEGRLGAPVLPAQGSGLDGAVALALAEGGR